MPLDLNAIAAQYTPLENLEPQLKAARLEWAKAVNALDAEISQLAVDKQVLALILPHIQTGVFSTTDTADIAEWLKDQIAVNADLAAIPPLQDAVAQAFQKWNGLKAQFDVAYGALTQNPGQIEQVQR